MWLVYCRFQVASNEGHNVAMGQSMMVDTIIPPAQLKPNMDIFAAGYAVFSFSKLFINAKLDCLIFQVFSYRIVHWRPAPLWLRSTAVLQVGRDGNYSSYWKNWRFGYSSTERFIYCINGWIQISLFLLTGLSASHDSSRSGKAIISRRIFTVATRQLVSRVFLQSAIRVYAEFDATSMGCSRRKNRQVKRAKWHVCKQALNHFIFRLHRDLPDLIGSLSADNCVLIIANIVISSLR